MEALLYLGQGIHPTLFPESLMPPTAVEYERTGTFCLKCRVTGMPHPLQQSLWLTLLVTFLSSSYTGMKVGREAGRGAGSVFTCRLCKYNSDKLNRVAYVIVDDQL